VKKRGQLGQKSIEHDARALRVLINSTPAPGGVVDHGGLLGLGDDDHGQYVHISSARTITAQHQFAPVAVQAPFSLGAKGQGQLVAGFRADQLNVRYAAEDSEPSPTHPGLLWIVLPAPWALDFSVRTYTALLAL